MTPQTDKELAPIVAASAEGEVIECKGGYSYSKWAIKSHKDWRVLDFTYRIAPVQPKPKVRMLGWRRTDTGALHAFPYEIFYNSSYWTRYPKLDDEVKL